MAGILYSLKAPIYICPAMRLKVFDHARVRQLLTIALLSGTLLCIFPPQLPSFQWWAGQAFYIAVGYLLFGLFFLIIDNPRLMFVCFGCSAAISFFKNETPLTPEHTSLENRPALEMQHLPSNTENDTDYYLLPQHPADNN